MLYILEVRAKNALSYPYLHVKLGRNTTIIGPNDAGKSNLIRIIRIGTAACDDSISLNDIYIAEGEILDKTKSAIIDIKFRLDLDNTNIQNIKTIGLILSRAIPNLSVYSKVHRSIEFGLRTEIIYDPLSNKGIAEHSLLNAWHDSIETTVIDSPISINSSFKNIFNIFHIDAERDYISLLNDRNSLLSRAFNFMEVEPEIRHSLAALLSKANQKVIQATPSLQKIQETMEPIANTLGSKGSCVEVNAIPTALNKAINTLQFIFKNGTGPSLPLDQHGLGTQTLGIFLILSAYLHQVHEHITNAGIDALFLALLEEPESHTEPAGHRRIFNFINQLNAQTIVTTHSPYFLQQADLSDVIHISLANGHSEIHRLDQNEFTSEELSRIKREVIKTRGELLFTKVIVFCEGITESNALPIFCREVFGDFASEILFVDVGGVKYRAFLKLAKTFGLNWFIFSDGEPSTIKSVNKAVSEVFGAEYQESELRTIFLSDGNCYEEALISDGYMPQMVEAINLLELNNTNYKNNPNEDFILCYKETQQKQFKKRIKTSDICPTCHQAIYTDVYYDYSGNDGYKRALLDFCLKNKARLAEPIAEAIVAMPDKQKRIPPKINDLFANITKTLSPTNISNNISEL